MIVNFGLRKNLGSVEYPNFWLPFTDSGSGAVNLTLSRGTGSATFTRAGATATTVLSTGLVSSVIAANTARSYYDPAPAGGTASYMYVPGVSGAYASTPDSAAVSITGDIDIRVQVALADYSPSTSQVLVGKYAGVQSSYLLLLESTNNLRFFGSADGSTNTDAGLSSTVALNTVVSDGNTIWVRCTKSTTTGEIKYYTSTNGTDWTQLGATVAGAVYNFFNGTANLEVGTYNSGTAGPSTGRFYRAQLYNGINGTLVADFNPTRTTQGQTSFAAATGETWTINGRGYMYAAPAYLGYIAEEARTNICLQSQDFGVTWAAVGTPTRSAAAKTCGSVNLDLLGDDAAGTLEGYTQTITYTADATKTISVFFSQGTSASSVVRLRDTTAGADRLLAAITWSGATPVITMTTGTNQGVDTFPNGIFRLRVLTTSVTAANVNSIQFYPATDAALSVANTGDIYWGGVQSENGAFATSYIPTTTASVTRAADVLTYPSAGNVSSTVGTAFSRATKFVDSSTAQTLINAGGAGEYPMSTGGSTNSVAIFDGTNVASSGATFTGTSTFRIASVWGSNIKISVNATFGSSNSFDGSMGFGANIGIGARTAGDQQFNGTIRDIRIWQRVLSDSQIASIR